MRPIVYYGNLYSQGVLSGTVDALDNPVRRVGDESINLAYTITSGLSGGVRSGEANVTLAASGASPVALCVHRHTIPSGTYVAVSGTDFDSGNPVGLRFAQVSGEDPLVLLLTGQVRGIYFTHVFNPVSGDTQYEAAELQLATTRYQLPRSPLVGVRRTKVRQFARLEVPGGQPFTLRVGPMLRQTTYNVVLVSGSQVDDAEAFVEAVQGGESFTLTDDLGDSYWAELLGGTVDFDDQAGVYNLRLTFQEIRVE